MYTKTVLVSIFLIVSAKAQEPINISANQINKQLTIVLQHRDKDPQFTELLAKFFNFCNERNKIKQRQAVEKLIKIN